MKDLIERLLIAANKLAELLQEAADELERLTAERDALTAERDALKEANNQLNQAGFTLTSHLCGIRVVEEKHGFELIRRESVMELVTSWRRAINAAIQGAKT